MKEWLTVTEAVQAVRKDRSTIYRWITAGRVRTLTRVDNVLLISRTDLMDTTATIKRGRPRGAASINQRSLTTLRHLLDTPTKYVQ